MSVTYAIIGTDGAYIPFDNQSYAMLREGLEGLSQYPAEYESSKTPGSIGSSVVNTSFNEREISLPVLILGEGRAQLEERRAALIRALNPLCGLGYALFVWYREDGSVYYLQCRPDEGSPDFSSGTAHGARSWPCTITLICHNPCWLGSEIESHTLIGKDNGFSLPFSLPFTFGSSSPRKTIVNNGTSPVPVLITLVGKLKAPIEFKNNTTGESIVVKKDVLEGDYLIIDTNREYLHVTYINGTTGVESDALFYCSVGSRFWQLGIGENDISVSYAEKSADASVVLTFRERQVAL